MRDLVTAPLTLDYFERRKQEGWTLVAVEWARTGAEAPGPTESGITSFEVPYGYRIGSDCHHLERDPTEFNVLSFIMERVVKEQSAPAIADELNLRGYRTRKGSRWTAAHVFDLLPQLVQVGPQILTMGDWPARRRQLAPAS
jgi:hypothetical protein